MLFNFLLIVLGFGLLIFVHELGHFLAAKWANIRTEAFAIGMGPVVCAYRKGIGVRVGSTEPAYLKEVENHLNAQDDPETKKLRDLARSNKLTREQIYAVGDRLGLGETEYSLRWLPIGGFVKMLGQEDANPNYVSSDPRSYNRCSVPKRMVVVSAGVIMNLILAVILFVWAFMVGVRFPAPVVGDVAPGSPAAVAIASNADALGVTQAGLLPGDIFVEIDDAKMDTFNDVQIEVAMSKDPLNVLVQRRGINEPLRFEIAPEFDERQQLRSIGVAPGTSSTLVETVDAALRAHIDRAGLTNVEGGMRMISANGADVTTYGEISRIANDSEGRDIVTRWTALDDDKTPTGIPIEASLRVAPEFTAYLYRDQVPDHGLLGLCPLVRLIVPDDSHNHGTLLTGDVVLAIAGVKFPRESQFRTKIMALAEAGDDSVVLRVQRAGAPVDVTCSIEKGKVGVLTEAALDVPLSAAPIESSSRPMVSDPTKLEDVVTPIAAASALPGLELVSVDGAPIRNWRDYRQGLKDATAAMHQGERGGSVRLTVRFPTPGTPEEDLDLELSPLDVAAIHALGWLPRLDAARFQSIQTILTADGSPVKAVGMGFKRTRNLIIQVYVTIDRLFRGTVGVEQLRGPVGIVHIGVQVAERGFMYLIFLLAMISVNLAVINFLPLPIVDGGLFLFLIYEGAKGKPPSLAFQNAATIVGLCLIGFILVVTLYNDVLRLIA